MNQIKERVLVFHNIRSAYNVGSIFRTSEAAGIDRIFLTGYTPAPLDEFGRKRKDISKTALGAEKNIDWEKIKNLSNVITKLKKDDYEIIAVEQSECAIDYRDVSLSNKTAFIFGNEVRGLSRNVISKMDKTIEIPMRGKKESLNVSVSTGVILFNFL